MNKLIITASLCFASALSCNAQQRNIDKATICCLYTHYVKTETKEHVAAVDSFYSILEVGERIYKYGELATYTAHKKFLPDEMKWLEKEDCLRDEHLWVTQNYPEEGVMTVVEAMHPAFFQYTESMDSIRWELMPGDSTIMECLCHKARMQYAGRSWTAWYTEKIPVASGPWKLVGLPGLVLYAWDDSGTHVFQANSVFNVENQPITAVNDKWSTTKDTKRDTFIKTRNKVKCDPVWVLLPYFNDQSNVKMTIFNQKAREEMGTRPFIWVNRIKYPCRELGDGDLDYIYNCFQPLELY